MRDINRIDKIIDVLRETWKSVPDWRLGQLFENFKRYMKAEEGLDGMFFIEDDELLEKLEKFNREINY